MAFKVNRTDYDPIFDPVEESRALIFDILPEEAEKAFRAVFGEFQTLFSSFQRELTFRLETNRISRGNHQRSFREMTNVYATPEKGRMRAILMQVGMDALRREGWTVEKAGLGKSSVRRITKGKDSRLVSIRTSQDCWVAFPRSAGDQGWLTLDDVDLVLAVSVDDKYMPREARAHLIPADKMRERYDRAYAARMAADFSIPVGRGVWLSLYQKEAKDPVTLVGAGAGLEYPAIYTVPLDGRSRVEPEAEAAANEAGGEDDDETPLTIAEAKRRLAITFGVDPSAIKIIVEG